MSTAVEEPSSPWNENSTKIILNLTSSEEIKSSPTLEENKWNDETQIEKKDTNLDQNQDSDFSKEEDSINLSKDDSSDDLLLSELPRNKFPKSAKSVFERRSNNSVSSNLSFISSISDLAADYSPTDTNSVIDSPGNCSTVVEEETANLLLARIKSEKEVQKEETTNNGFDPFSFIKSSFLAVKESVVGQEKENDVDWDFWGKVVSDFDRVALKHSRTLTKKIQLGIPSALRGMVWLLLCKGKNPELEAVYTTLLTRSTTHEKLIQRDLSRTYPKVEYFQGNDGPGQEALFNVIKAYSLYDLEVGYCQGISFVVGALLMNMPEEEAFCALVQLMKQYRFRELYTSDMAGLQLRIYQFDNILKEHLPLIQKHLEKEGIQSNMYASQWFLTLFAYRFPLDVVFRIMDMVFAEGFETMFKIAIALLKKNKDYILSLDFESLLEYLKNGLFDVYISSDTITSTSNGLEKSPTQVASSPTNTEKLTTTNLISDASQIKLYKSTLVKLETEFLEQQKNDNDPELQEAKQLRSQNRVLAENFKKIEEAYELLNREHIILANDNLERKTLMEKQKEKLEELEEQVNSLKQILLDDRKKAENLVKDEMDLLMNKNFNLTKRNCELQDINLEQDDVIFNLKRKNFNLEQEKIELLKKINEKK
ncbi:GTPase-activating protein [Lobulomyces angularis]|nr:GTPase-activating protein [Lobulomyces angularis]